MQTLLIVGASGAQGSAVVKYLSSTGRYHILAMVRDTRSARSKDLESFPDVELVANNTTHAFDADAYISAAERSDLVFVNTDGFSLGEQAETYWGIRFFELAVGAGVKHFVWSGLDYNFKKSGYDPRYYVGHYEGKAKVQEWMHAQTDSSMAYTIIRSGPYMEDLYDVMPPALNEDGTYIFQLPLADGAVPFIHLDDFGPYVDWAFSHPAESNRMDFGIATAHVSGAELADVFTRVTGRAAAYVDVPIDAWHAAAWASLPQGPDTKIGYKYTDPGALLMTYRENFGNWWNLYKASAENKGLIQRDYELLDRLHPERVKSVQGWLVKTGWKGEKRDNLATQH